MPKIDTSPAALRALAEYWSNDKFESVAPDEEITIAGILQETDAKMAATIATLLALAAEKEAASAPSHTDLMVAPETLDAFMEANPLSDPDGWVYKIYRQEWVTRVFPVDQYGQEVNAPDYYVKAHPTREAAEADLHRIAKPHKYVSGRMISDLAPTAYHEAKVSWRQVEVTNAPVPTPPTIPNPHDVFLGFMNGAIAKPEVWQIIEAYGQEALIEGLKLFAPDARAASDGWIEWAGGECPLSDKPAEIKFRSGRYSLAFVSTQLRWKHLGLDGDIVAYRIIHS